MSWILTCVLVAELNSYKKNKTGIAWSGLQPRSHVYCKTLHIRGWVSGLSRLLIITRDNRYKRRKGNTLKNKVLNGNCLFYYEAIVQFVVETSFDLTSVRFTMAEEAKLLNNNEWWYCMVPLPWLIFPRLIFCKIIVFGCFKTTCKALGLSHCYCITWHLGTAW